MQASTPEDLGLPFRWCARIIEFEDTGCWLWIGAASPTGYGVTSYQGRQVNAHRAVYQYLNGSIPSDRDLDHLCRVRPCVNPFHMEVVTRQTNVLRGDAPEVTKTRHRAVTECPQGHAYTPSNTGYSKVRGYTVRYCKLCKRLKAAERRAKGGKSA